MREYEDFQLFKIQKFKDNRGLFYENFNYKNFKYRIKQSNISVSKKNVLRGIHYQIKKPIGYIVTVIEGSIFEVIIDLRKNSKNFLKTYTFNFDQHSKKNLYIPPGFGHAFLCLSNYCILNYLCSDTYKKENERGLNSFDKNLNIDWPKKNYIINYRDKCFPLYKDILKKDLP